MSQEIASVPQLHADHRHWKSEISMWREDIAYWRAEHETALECLKEITTIIRDHAEGLQQHEHKLTVIDNAVDYHEKMLKESLRGGSDPDLDDALAERHEEQTNAIATQREAHERIKKHHHVAMAQVAILKAALEAAM